MFARDGRGGGATVDEATMADEGGAGVVACHAAESIFKPSSTIPLIDIAIYIPTHAEQFTLSECKTAARARAPDTV